MEENNSQADIPHEILGRPVIGLCPECKGEGVLWGLVELDQLVKVAASFGNMLQFYLPQQLLFLGMTASSWGKAGPKKDISNQLVVELLIERTFIWSLKGHWLFVPHVWYIDSGIALFLIY